MNTRSPMTSGPRGIEASTAPAAPVAGDRLGPEDGKGAGGGANPGRWIVLLALLSAAIAASVLVLDGTGVDGVRMALRATARVSLVWFLAAYVAAPLDRLRPGGAGGWLKRHRRVFGIVFGLSMSMHVGFILWLYALHAPQRPPMVNDTDFTIGIPGLVLVAAMTVTSLRAVGRAVGPRAWRLLHRTGLHFVWAVFFLCLVDSSARKETNHLVLEYGVFLAALLAAAGLRALAWRSRRGGNPRK